MFKVMEDPEVSGSIHAYDRLIVQSPPIALTLFHHNFAAAPIDVISL